MVHAMRELYQQLLDDKCRLPLLSGGRTAADLTELDLQTLGTMTMSLMANLFLRCVLPFRDEWPWHLIHVYAGDPTALNQFLACNTDCCFSAVDGYSDALNWLCPSAAEVLARRERDCWNDTVDMCPCTLAIFGSRSATTAARFRITIVTRPWLAPSTRSKAALPWPAEGK